MRSIFLFLTLFVLFSSCDTPSDCSVNLTIQATNLSENDLHRMNVILVSEDDNREQHIDFKKEHSIKITGLKPSNYEIVFINRYGELMIIRFSLREGNKTATHTLYYDEIDPNAYLKERRIDKLKNGDRLRIEVESSGCFGSSEETAVFYQEKDQIFATNYSDTVLLDSSAVCQIRRFETELGYPHIGGCTSQDIYRVFFNMKEILYVEDRSCGWSGYYYYIAPLFKNKEE